MNKLKILYFAGILLVLALIIGFIFYFPKYKENKRAMEIKNARIADLREKNPGLLEKLLAGIKRGEETVKQKPGDFEAWKDLAVAYEAVADYNSAEEAYKKANEINPVNALIWNNLGEMYINQKRYQEAKEAFLKLLEADPTNMETYLKLAEMYAQGHAGTIDDARFILGQGILKTNSNTLKDAQERLNKEGKL